MEFVGLIGFTLLLVIGVVLALLHAYRLGGKGQYQAGYDAAERKYLKQAEAQRSALPPGQVVRSLLGGASIVVVEAQRAPRQRK